jgi:hypothetical protein
MLFKGSVQLPEEVCNFVLGFLATKARRETASVNAFTVSIR